MLREENKQLKEEQERLVKIESEAERLRDKVV